MKVANLVSLDVYRDGGSISCSFKADNFDGEHTLFFCIKNGPSFDRSLKSAVYSDPELQICERTIYTCPMTNAQIPDSKRTVRPVSWEEARGILKDIRPFVPGFTSNYLWVYEEMLNAANGNGDTVTTALTNRSTGAGNI